MHATEYDRLLASLPDAVIGVRLDLTVSLWNAAAETLIGRARTRAVGRGLADLFGADARLTRRLVETLQLAESRAEAESEVIALDGRTVPVSLLTAPIHDPAGEIRGAVAVLRDLSRLKALEAEVRRGERLAALGQMALALAHEIRNPLGAIRGVAQLLGDELGGGAYREHVTVMLAEIDRMNRVMEALLDLGRPLTVAFGAVNLHELLERVCLLAEPLARRQGVQLVRRYDPSLPALWADPDRLTQVFQNLVQNGIEAMPGGGRLTLTTRMSLDAVYGKVDLRAGLPARPLVEVQVADEGEGIPASLGDRVFDPFVTTKPRGLGLGLALSARIVEEHKGALRVASTPGKGTTFTCYLPSRAGPAP